MFSLSSCITLMCAFHHRCGSQSSFASLDSSIGKRIVKSLDGVETLKIDSASSLVKGHIGAIPDGTIKKRIRRGRLTALEYEKWSLDSDTYKEIEIFRPLSCTNSMNVSMQDLLASREYQWVGKGPTDLSGWSIETITMGDTDVICCFVRELIIHSPANMGTPGSRFKITLTIIRPKVRVVSFTDDGRKLLRIKLQERGSIFREKNAHVEEWDLLLTLLSMLPQELTAIYTRDIL